MDDFKEAAEIEAKTPITVGNMDEALKKVIYEAKTPFDCANERCWVLLGKQKGDLWYGKMHRMSEGAPASVAFDANWVLKREEEHGDVIGMCHSHPGMVNHYSSRDDRTMKAWAACFAKPLACCIQGTNGLTAWWYVDDENPPEEYQVARVGRLVFGVTPELYE